MIGSAIAKKRGVLLTGGDSSSGKAVKERAIAGAEAVRGEGFLGPWIGVSRGASRPSFRADDDKSFVIQTDLNHKRNYLEACLCDAAIAFEGGKGTVSEVTFCLSLQKPVVLIGNWQSKYPLEKPETLKKLVREAFDRVGRDSSGDSMLNELLSEGPILTKLQEFLPTYKYHPMPKELDRPRSSEEAVEDVFIFLKPLPDTGFKGAFLELERYKSDKAECDSWLRRIEERLTAAA